MTVLGYVFGLGLFFMGMQEGGTTKLFLNGHALILVLGGTVAAAMISNSFKTTVLALKAIRIIFFPKRLLPAEATIQIMVDLAEKARREGVAALPEEAKRYNDPFLQNGIQLVADGLPSHTVEEVMAEDVHHIRNRHRAISDFYRVAGVYGPMFGLLGTLIGIVQVLSHLSDPSRVGPAMAVAITTAFYGIFLANFICLPIANKLKIRSEEELALKELIMLGVIAIESGDLPMLVRKKISTYLSYSAKGGKNTKGRP